MEKTQRQHKKKFQIPHIYIVIIALLILTALLTYVIPSGTYGYVYDEAAGREIVNPESFAYEEQNNPTGFYELITCIPSGMAASVDVIMMVIIVCGAFRIISDTGALNAGIFALLKKMNGKNKVVLSVITIIFALLSGCLGWAEQMLVFVPVTVAMAIAMGYDNLMGLLVVALGGAAGFTAGPLNIYTTGICQGIAGLPLYSALGYRSFAWVIFTAIAVLTVCSYANRLEKDKKNSYLYGVDGIITPDLSEVPEFSTRRKLVFIVALLGVALSAVGCAQMGWGIQQITGELLFTGIICGIVGGMRGGDICASFIEGAKEIAPAALVIGGARGILYLMETAQILHTIIYYLAGVLGNLPSVVSAVGINVATTALNFFVVSATAKGSILMPILAPLADILGISRQLVILAFQFGDGFTNYFWPTSGIVMAGTAMAGGIPWDRWAKATWKYMLISSLSGIVLVVAAYFLNIT